MFNSAVIDTLIGLMLLYASLALVASGITEIVNVWLKTRPKLLEQAVGQLLGSGLFERFYRQPRIALLTSVPDDVSAGMRLPSYLAPATFASVMFRCLLEYLDVDPVKVASEAGPKAEGAGFAAFIAALELRLDPAKAKPLPETEARVLRLALQGARRAEAAATSTAERIQVFHQELEAFYGELMDRVSGWFKRKSHTVAVIVAILVCAFVNADTVQVARTLSSSPELRASLARAAVDAEAGAKTVAGPDCAAYLDLGSEALESRSAEELARIKQCQRAATEIRLSQVGTAFPIGWVKSELPAALLPWSMKVLGILISGLAVSLGAAFWFTALKGILRLSGRVPGEAAATK